MYQYPFASTIQGKLLISKIFDTLTDFWSYVFVKMIQDILYVSLLANITKVQRQFLTTDKNLPPYYVHCQFMYVLNINTLIRILRF